MWVQFLAWKNPLEEEMETHSSTLVWKIPATQETGSYSSWFQKESDMTEHIPRL